MTLTNQQGAAEGKLILLNKPDEVLAEARLAAKALKDVISMKVEPVFFKGEQYLEYEDWQTVAQFYGYCAQTRDATPVEVNGVQGFKAEADLVEFRSGRVIGHAEAYCMRDEEKWNTRPKYEWRDGPNGREKFQVGEEQVPWYQLASMSQTRAGAKALRNRLAWVVVLAGYRATPAEELPTEERDHKATGPSNEHWCKIHSVAFFKRGKMPSYGHPLKDEKGNDTGKWCREEATPKAEAKDPATEVKAESPKAPPMTAPVAPPTPSVATDSPASPASGATRRFANIGQVLAAANQQGLDRDTCLKAWRETWGEIKDVSQIKNADGAWMDLVRRKLVNDIA